jgi:hypothetical protein
MQTLASSQARYAPLLQATNQLQAPDLLLTRQVPSTSSHRCELLARFIRFCDGNDLLVRNQWTKSHKSLSWRHSLVFGSHRITLVAQLHHWTG